MKTNGVDICVETFGNAGDPAILLIMGMGGSMLAWPEDLCRRLAAGRRYVIRYDHRDTGRSVTYPPKAPGYTWRDLVGDPIGILDALGIDSAHVAGISMGGAIAQVLASSGPSGSHHLPCCRPPWSATAPGSPE